MLLDAESIKSMAPGRFFRDHKGAINSLDFHHSEDVMVTVGASVGSVPARLAPPPSLSFPFRIAVMTRDVIPSLTVGAAFR